MVTQVSANNSVGVTDVHFYSESIGGLLWYRAIAPKLSPSEKLPVLYLLHGINSGPIEIMQHSAVGKLASIHRLIVILPEAEFSYYVNAKHRWH
jgi:poly(3-hydroxybutyrate) depolymerase